MTEANGEARGSQNMTEQPSETTAGTAQNPSGGDHDPSGQREELRQEIQQTREELEETVEALAEKADVKAQARDKVAEGKQALRDKASELGQKAQRAAPDQAQRVFGQAIAEARQRPMSAAVAFLFGLLLGGILRKKAPRAAQRKYGWRQVLAAAALQGAILSLAKVAIDRGGAKGFGKLMGAWPGD